MARINYPKEMVKTDGRKLVAGGPRDMQRRVLSSELPATSDSETIDKLLKKIDELNHSLRQQTTSARTVVPDGYMSPEQVDGEVRKAVADAVKETTLAMKKVNQATSQSLEPTLQKYKVQIVELQKTNDDLVRLHAEIAKQNNEYKEKMLELDEQKKTLKEFEIKIAVLEQSLKDKEELVIVLKSRTSGGAVVEEDPNRPKIDSVFIDPLGPDAGKGLKSFIQTEDVTREEKEEMQNKVSKLKNLLGKLPVRRQEG